MTAVPAPSIPNTPNTKFRAAIRAAAYCGPAALLAARPSPRHELLLFAAVTLIAVVAGLTGRVRDYVQNRLMLRSMRRRALASAHAAGCKVFVDTPDLTFFCGGCADRPTPAP